MAHFTFITFQWLLKIKSIPQKAPKDAPFGITKTWFSTDHRWLGHHSEGQKDKVQGHQAALVGCTGRPTWTYSNGDLSICVRDVYPVTTCRPGRGISRRPPAYSMFSSWAHFTLSHVVEIGPELFESFRYSTVRTLSYIIFSVVDDNKLCAWRHIMPPSPSPPPWAPKRLRAAKQTQHSSTFPHRIRSHADRCSPLTR